MDSTGVGAKEELFVGDETGEELEFSWGESTEDYDFGSLVPSSGPEGVPYCPSNSDQVPVRLDTNTSDTSYQVCAAMPMREGSFSTPVGACNAAMPVNENQGLVCTMMERDRTPQSRTCALLRNRSKPVPWTKDEHKLFLMGVMMLGNKWSKIREHFVSSKTTKQFGSHVQKFLQRVLTPEQDRKKRTIHDVRLDDITREDVMRLAPKKWQHAVLSAMPTWSNAALREFAAGTNRSTGASQEPAAVHSAPAPQPTPSIASAGFVGTPIQLQQLPLQATQGAFPITSAPTARPASSTGFAPLPVQQHVLNFPYPHVQRQRPPYFRMQAPLPQLGRPQWYYPNPTFQTEADPRVVRSPRGTYYRCAPPKQWNGKNNQ